MSLYELVQAELEAIALSRQQVEQAKKAAAELEAKRRIAVIKEELGSFLESAGEGWRIDGDRGMVFTRLYFSEHHWAVLGLERTVSEPLYVLSIEPQRSDRAPAAPYYRGDTYLDPQSLEMPQAIARIVAEWMAKYGLTLSNGDKS